MHYFAINAKLKLVPLIFSCSSESCWISLGEKKDLE